MSPATAVAPPSTKQRPLVSRAFEVATAPDPLHVSGVRHDTAAVLRRWAVPPSLAYDVVLVVSELVSNAVEHGLGGVSLRVRRADGELCIEVSDDNPAPARLRAAGDYDVSGRGLFLVAVLARDWGVSTDGKTTWATFRLPARRS
ncbi:ATP-binding protein [Streptomyces tubercidicus]|uniref:ATP-binding protein n=1 Tax=Streptomyces tubercidicus TaxID=47759 RepID=UPI0036825084